MNKKQLLILIVAGVVLGGIGLSLYNRQKESFRTSEAQEGAKLLAAFPLNDVAQVTIKEPKSEVNLVKQEDGWKVRERYNYPANFSEISDLVRKLADLKAGRPIEVGASQLGRLELTQGSGTNSGTVLQLKDKSGKALQSLTLGKKYTKGSGSDSPMGGGDFPAGRYVSTEGNPPKVWLISDPLSNVEAKPESWLNKDFFKIDRIKSVSVTHTNATNSWKLVRENETADMKLVDAKPEEQTDTGKASSAAHVLSSPSFNDVVSALDKPDAPGLTNAIKARIETFDDLVYDIQLAKAAQGEDYDLAMKVDGKISKERTPGKDEKPEDKEKLDKEFKDKASKLEEKLKQEKSYEKWVYLVPKWSLDALLKDRKDLLAEKKEEKKEETKSEPIVPGLPDILKAPADASAVPKAPVANPQPNAPVPAPAPPAEKK